MAPPKSSPRSRATRSASIAAQACAPSAGRRARPWPGCATLASSPTSRPGAAAPGARRRAASTASATITREVRGRGAREHRVCRQREAVIVRMAQRRAEHRAEHQRAEHVGVQAFHARRCWVSDDSRSISRQQQATSAACAARRRGGRSRRSGSRSRSCAGRAGRTRPGCRAASGTGCPRPAPGALPRAAAPSIGVSKVPGAIVSTRMPALDRSRAAGNVMPADAGLGRGVRDLTDLPVEGRDRGGVDDHAALAARLRRVLGHRRRGQAQHVEACRPG